MSLHRRTSGTKSAIFLSLDFRRVCGRGDWFMLWKVAIGKLETWLFANVALYFSTQPEEASSI